MEPGRTPREILWRCPSTARWASTTANRVQGSNKNRPPCGGEGPGRYDSPCIATSAARGKRSGDLSAPPALAPPVIGWRRRLEGLHVAYRRIGSAELVERVPAQYVNKVAGSGDRGWTDHQRKA